MRNIIEVSRYLYRGENSHSLERFPVGVAQARVLQLLIEGHINLYHVYGLDKEGRFCNKNKEIHFYGKIKEEYAFTRATEKEDRYHRSPDGLVTRCNLLNAVSVKEAESKAVE